MKRITGTLSTCVRQAADLWSSTNREELIPVNADIRCQLQGKLMKGLYLVPGETEAMTLKRLGEAISTQARVKPSPLEQQPTILEYDETGVGQVINDRRVLGTFSFIGEADPVALLYYVDREAAEKQQ
jgi:hypothetical protein